MKRAFISFLVILLLIGLSATGGLTFEKGLGYLGKSEDYEQTIKRFKRILPDFRTFVAQLPSAFDWRDHGKVTPAKDQGRCGSCWAFASVGTIESKILINGGPHYDISEQQLVSCDTSMYGCCGGTEEALQFWYSKGPMLESCTGYGDFDTCDPGCECGGWIPPHISEVPCADLSACRKLPYNTTGYYTVYTSEIDEIKTSLYRDGPAFFGYDVYSDFFDFWNTATLGDVYTQATGELEGGHAVLIIGWDDSKSAWLCKNSWGAIDGPNGDGTFWIAYSGHANNLNFGMANVQVIPQCDGGYIHETVAFNFEDIRSTGINLNLSYGAHAYISIPFTFSFYCANYNAVSVRSSGNVYFTDAETYDYENRCIPGTDDINTFIAPFWDDLVPLAGGSGVYYEVRGTAPSRRLIVQWTDLSCWSLTGEATFQLILYEGSNKILFQYLDVQLGDTQCDNGASATVGVQWNPTKGTQYSCNAASLNDGLAILFTYKPATKGVPWLMPLLLGE